MSRSFIRLASQYMGGAAPLTAAPLSMAAWVKPAQVTNFLDVMGLYAAGGEGAFYLDISASNGACAIAHDSSSFFSSVGSATPLPGQWGHICGVFASSTSRTGYWNAATTGAETTSCVPTGINRIEVGRFISNSFGSTNYFDGVIAWPCVWAGALAAADVARLATGEWPLDVRPDLSPILWSLDGESDPELDEGGFIPLTLTAGPSSSLETPPPRRPIVSRSWLKPGTAGGANAAATREGLRRNVGRMVG
jgi:hypothetical protein